MESLIKSRIPGLQSLISKTILDLETELNRLGNPIAADSGVNFYKMTILPLSLFEIDRGVFVNFFFQGKLYMIMEICRAFDQTFKEHLDGM